MLELSRCPLPSLAASSCRVSLASTWRTFLNLSFNAETTDSHVSYVIKIIVAIFSYYAKLASYIIAQLTLNTKGPTQTQRDRR